MSQSDIEYCAWEAQMSAASAHERVAQEQMRPFYLLKPPVFPDGNQWCALYGSNLQEGVAGFGDTPAKAAEQFDVQWLNERARIDFALAPKDSNGDTDLSRCTREQLIELIRECQRALLDANENLK